LTFTKIITIRIIKADFHFLKSDRTGWKTNVSDANANVRAEEPIIIEYIP